MTERTQNSSWASSARVTLLSQWARLAIQVVGFVVLSRLLPPSDFGLVAMVAVIVNVAGLLADFGLSLAGLQADDLSGGQKSNLFWLNVGAGAVAAVVVAASSPILVLFYDESRLLGIGCVIAASLLISGIGVQFRVEINRSRRYVALAAQDVIAAGCGLIVAALAAFAGWGYWSLVLLSVIPPLLITVLSVAMARWWPRGYDRSAPVANLVRFGGHNLLLQLANLLSRSADVMAIGRTQGATELGLYSRATQLVALAFQQLVTPLTRVVLPRLVELKDDRVQFDSQLIRLQSLITSALPAVISLLAAVATPLVVVFLGATWAATGELLQILCAGALMQAIAYIFYWAYLADGRSGVLLISEMPGRVVMIVGAVVVAPFGAPAVAWVMTAGQAVMLLTSTILAERAGLPGLRLVRTALAPLIIYVLAFGASVVAQQWLVDSSHWIQLLVGVVVWSLPLFVSAAFPRVRRHVFDLMRMLRH